MYFLLDLNLMYFLTQRRNYEFAPFEIPKSKRSILPNLVRLKSSYADSKE